MRSLALLTAVGATCSLTFVLPARAEPIGQTTHGSCLTTPNAILPGTACRKVGGGGTLGITPDGAIYNDAPAGGAPLVVECPVPSSPVGLVTQPGSDFVYLDNSTASITCFLRAEDAGSTGVRVLNFSSTGDDASYRIHDMQGLQGFVGGMMHLRCTIPTRDTAGNASYIVGYLVIDDHDASTSCGESDYVSLTGSTCRHISGGKIGVTADGAIFNDVPSTGTALTVDCPLITAPANASGLPTASKTKVWYLDNSPNGLVCTLIAEDSAGSARDSFAFISNADDNNYRSYTFSGIGEVTTFSGGYMHLRCIIPPRDAGGAASYVVGYALDF